MSIDNETCQSNFSPALFFTKAKSFYNPSQTLYLRDLDVVSCGTGRKNRILDFIKSGAKIILQIHESFLPQDIRTVYHDELLSTLEWLGPWKTVSVENFDLRLAHLEMFEWIFPLTKLNLAEDFIPVVNEYLSEQDLNTWILQDHWRYFAGFLRRRFAHNKKLLEIANWEWAMASVEMQFIDMGSFSIKQKTDELSEQDKQVGFSAQQETDLESEPHQQQPAGGSEGSNPDQILELSPSLQIVALSENRPELDKEAGLYALVYSVKKARPVVKKLDAPAALLIDFIEDGRANTKSRLMNFAVHSSGSFFQLSITEWSQVYESLLASDIILVHSV